MENFGAADMDKDDENKIDESIANSSEGTTEAESQTESSINIEEPSASPVSESYTEELSEELTPDIEESKEDISEPKVIDGFEEANSSMRYEQRESVNNIPASGEKTGLLKNIAIGIVAVLVIVGGVKLVKNMPKPELDDSIILVLNQTKVSPDKITIYLKTIYGVAAPVIKVPGLGKQEFTLKEADVANKVTTWYWTVEGKKASKAFNKKAVLKMVKGKESYYTEELVLDKEIRIDYTK